MRLLVLITAFILPLTVFGSHTAKADPKPIIWSWWPGHWDKMDFERRYLEDPKIPHNILWEDKDWSPQEWTHTRGSAQAVLDDLYIGGIITGQYEDEDNIPVLEVGQPFMQLAARERRRILRFIDYVYGITESTENGMFFIEHAKTDKPLGIYTKHGVQFQ